MPATNTIAETATVESTTDCATWRAAGIELSRKLSLQPGKNSSYPLDPLPLNSAVGRRNECTCPETYSQSVVKELTDLLAQERKSHALTTVEAERRITALEARIAVRDAEIARHVAMCQCLPSRTEVPGHIDVLTKLERRKIAAGVAFTNKALRSEVAFLEHEVRSPTGVR